MIKKGFTLAETLIVIGIIGVVAAITIPTIITNYREKATANQVKKAYALLSQAVKLAEVENGPVEGWNWGEEKEDINGEVNVLNILAPHLKMLKICGADIGEGCFPRGVMYKYLDGTDYGVIDDLDTRAKAMLLNGNSLHVYSYGDSCEHNLGDSPLDRICGNITVDINGVNGPNQYGKDVFAFHVTAYGVVPLGIKGYKSKSLSTEKQCNPEGKGLYCAAYVIQKGKLDYLKKSVTLD